MAIKTFTTGEVLTAADTNTYLANAGLVYVGHTTAGSSVTTITLNNVFSSTYNSYRIVLNGGSASGLIVAELQLINSGGTASTTTYYEVFMFSPYNGSGVSTSNTNNGTSFKRAATAVDASDTLSGAFDLHDPFASKYTHYYLAGNPAGDNGGVSIGYHKSATSYTGVKFSLNAAVTGTIVTVYGYRLG